MTTPHPHNVIGANNGSRETRTPHDARFSTTVIVAVSEAAALDKAERILRDELVAVDAACSRFRQDSELWGLHRANGTPVRVSALLFDAITVALTWHNAAMVRWTPPWGTPWRRWATTGTLSSSTQMLSSSR